MTTAIVVGSGPNGLTAAAVLARAGVSVTVIEGADTIGGGTRTSELIESGVLHDECSAVHPTAASSPAFRELGLLEHGLQWAFAEFDAGHPLDGGRAAVLSTSIEQTAAGLGRDGRAWSSFFAPLAKRVDRIIEEFFQPLLHVPRHPIDLGLFGAQVLPPATWNARRFADEATRALYAGITAHAIYPLGRVTSSAIGSMMIASGHRYGWPVAVGGSRSITDALASIVVEHGGRIETGRWVRSLRDLPAADIVMLDLSPQGAVSIAGDAMPASTAKAYGRWRYGPGAFKVDLVVDGPIPWTNEQVARAGTVHLGGTLEEIAAAERAVHRGVMPERPFVLVGQQYLADPSRSSGSHNPIWAYAHVPNGYTGDVTEAVLDQFERFAPGTRERVLGIAVRGPASLQEHNPNYIGGDIVTGSNDPMQVVFRPKASLHPYDTGIHGVYLCSAATPPGGGVHGMGGFNAAKRALRRL